MTDRTRNWAYAFKLLNEISAKTPAHTETKAKIGFLRSVLRDIKRDEEM